MRTALTESHPLRLTMVAFLIRFPRQDSSVRQTMRDGYFMKIEMRLRVLRAFVAEISRLRQCEICEDEAVTFDDDARLEVERCLEHRPGVRARVKFTALRAGVGLWR